MSEVIEKLFSIILDRKKNPKKDSYVNYLYDKGLDKILKKIGEESSEVIIAAKNNKQELIYEIADLSFHLLVLLASLEISPDDILIELEKRMKEE